MKYLFSRIEVYLLYFFEYLRFGEFRSAANAFLFMFTGKSFSRGGILKSRMGKFHTRPGTLDFQYINYAYELEIKRFIQKEQFDIFFDIGSCLGEYSIWLGKKGKKCIAFEPVLSSFTMIQKNIQLNSLEENVRVFNFGLGKENSIEYFELDKTNPGSNHRVKEPGSYSEKFEIFALDDIFESMKIDRNEKILIKIDIEGMEVEMLNGSRKFLTTHQNLVLIVEEKLTGESKIRETLSSIGHFEFGRIDDYNIFARKYNG